ncbi:hypothetical protein VTO42DRAFT_2662 [Malbranchea cinnamomea]
MSGQGFVYPEPFLQAMSVPLTVCREQPSWEKLAADARNAIASALDIHFSSPVPRVDSVAAPSISETQIPESVMQFLSEQQQTPSLPSTPANPSGRRRRATTGSYEDTITYTPATHRISKAKKGKRVHACQFPGCPKIFTRAEHRRRHELNHNPKATFVCQVEGCGKGFHRSDLLSRHLEKHESDGVPTKSQRSSPRKQSLDSSTSPSSVNISQHQPPSPFPSPSSTLPQPSNDQIPTTGGESSLPLWSGAALALNRVSGSIDSVYNYADEIPPPYLSPDRSVSPSSDEFPPQLQVVESSSGSIAGSSIASSPLPFNATFPDWKSLEAPLLESSDFPSINLDNNDILQSTYQLQYPYTDWSGLPCGEGQPLVPEAYVGMTEWR